MERKAERGRTIKEREKKKDLREEIGTKCYKQAVKHVFGHANRNQKKKKGEGVRERERERERERVRVREAKESFC